MRKFITAIACLAMATQAWSLDYTKGFFILNEDQYGVQSSSLNFYSYEDETVHNRVFQAENPGSSLGETCEFAEMFNGNIYFCSKQNRSTGGRFIVADAKSLKIKYSLNEYPSGGDTRSFCAVNAQKGYIATTAGVYIFDLEMMEVRGMVEGTANEGSLYSNQPGDMVFNAGKVFLAKQDLGVVVIDPATDAVTTTIEIDDIATVFKAGGKVYAAVNSSTWGAPTDSSVEKFIEINDEGVVEEITVPMSCSNTWFAWQPSKPAVKGSNIYYNCASMINYLCKYDLQTRTFTQEFVTFADGFQMYAPCVGMEPTTGELIAVTFKGYANTNYNINIINAETGAIKKTVPMNGNYWFSSMILFPEDAKRTAIDNVSATRQATGVTYYNLAGVASQTPFNGVNIVVTTYDDGSRTSTKQLIR